MGIFTNNLIFFFIITILSNLIFFKYYKYFSSSLKLYDYPDGKRKLHSKPVPQLGGLFIILNLSTFYIFNKLNFLNLLNIDKYTFFSLIFGQFLIFIIGFYDDKFSLKPNVKLTLIGIIIIICLSLDKTLVINSLYFETFNLQFGLAGANFIFTILCFLLFLNALNMFDGINLQVGLYTIWFLIYLILQNNIFLFLNIFLLILFLIYLFLNYKNLMYLGDSGTLLIAFTLGFFIIKSYNSGVIINTEIIFLLMAIPGLDMFRLFINRLMNNKHPFISDRNHLHHILENKIGFSKTTLIIQSLIIFPIILSLIIKPFIVIVLIIFIYLLLLLKFKN